MISSLARSLALLLAFVFLPALVPSQEAAKPATSSAIAGIWLGSLHPDGQTLRIQLHLQTAGAGPLTCVLDGIDQKAFGIPCSNVQVNGNAVSFDVPSVSGKWNGQLSTDDKTLNGTWTQGNSLPLVMERQEAA